MRKTASKRHRRKMSKKYRMTKRVRKSRQSRKRNMYVGGGGGQSAARPIKVTATKILPLAKALDDSDKAFDKIMTPNITYWNSETQSPFAVFKEYKTGEYRPTYFTIAGIWGHMTYIQASTVQNIYKNFDYPTKIGPVTGSLTTSQNYRNKYLFLREEYEILPESAGFTYPLPPKVVVIVAAGDDGAIRSIISANNPDITYEKYYSDKHIRPPTYPHHDKIYPFEATTKIESDQTGTQSASTVIASVEAMDGLRTPLLQPNTNENVPGRL